MILLLILLLRYVVVSTEGVENPGGTDSVQRGCGERLVLWLLKWLLPV